MNKWIGCDWFCDDQVNKWGPTTMTGFTEAEEWAWHCAKKWSGMIQPHWDLGVCNVFLEGSLWREHKQWSSTVGKAPKPSTISSIDITVEFSNYIICVIKKASPPFQQITHNWCLIRIMMSTVIHQLMIHQIWKIGFNKFKQNLSLQKLHENLR